MSSVSSIEAKTSSQMNSKQLKLKTSEFLANRRQPKLLEEIIINFEANVVNDGPITPYLLSLEQIFTEVHKSREMVNDVKPSKSKDSISEAQHCEWLREQYNKAWKLTLSAFSHPKEIESRQALVTAMRLLSVECRNNRDTATDSKGLNKFPYTNYSNVLQKLLSAEKSNNHLLNRFKEYGAYLDVVFHTWKLLPGITYKGNAASDIYIENYLDLLNAIPISAEVQDKKQIFFAPDEPFEFDYPYVRKNLNKVWSCIMIWDFSEKTHKQVLIMLLEKVLNHLDRPVLLTDFLMDSLDVGGPISLLALQGVFILIQQHNLTYPKLYEKLYSMFEPEVFHTKFKARLFYLADIFLSSSHLPENLVAAFAKRLARLSLVAPPQDIVTIIYFIGNLILRHPGLKRLIARPMGNEIPHDPFLMDERDPVQSNALESSLWEISMLKDHVVPSVAQAAKTIFNPLPKGEWNLASVLEINESDIFDQEILKRSKECALNFERPQHGNDKFSQYWKLA